METILRGAAIYVVLLVVMRFAGRRTFAEMTAFDLVLILIVSETTQQGLGGDDYSITNATLLIVTLVTIDIAFSHLKRASSAADKWLDGRPTLLVAKGEPDLKALNKSRVAIDEILESARQSQGLERLSQIKYAVLEVDGRISVIPAEAAR